MLNKTEKGVGDVMGSLVRIGLAIGLALQLTATAAEAQDHPLLVEGKTTLYQRVLTRPDARLHESPGGAELDDPVRPFDVYYVFARDGDWVQVGHAAEGPTQGWLPADKVIDWNQAIVVSFSNPAGRERTLLLQDQKAIVDLLNSEDLVGQVQALREQAIAGTLPEDSTVVSIEPETYVDIQDQFYILPILENELTFNPLNYEELKLLEVASIPQAFEPTQEPPSREDILRDFKVGVLLVMDSDPLDGPLYRGDPSRGRGSVSAHREFRHRRAGQLRTDRVPRQHRAGARARIHDQDLRRAEAGPAAGPGVAGTGRGQGGAGQLAGLQRGRVCRHRRRGEPGRLDPVRRPLHRADHRCRAQASTRIRRSASGRMPPP